MFMGYKNYIKSDGWNYQKDKLKKFYNGKECFICGSKKNINTHHKTYKRLGLEKLDDLLFVCQKHHFKIHQFAKKNKLNIWNATMQYKKNWKKQNGIRWGKYEIAQYFKNNKIC